MYMKTLQKDQVASYDIYVNTCRHIAIVEDTVAAPHNICMIQISGYTVHANGRG